MSRFEQVLFNGEMWYAYFKESVPLQVSALSKEALITYMDKKEKEGFLNNLIQKSVYDWIEYARLSAQDYHSNVLIEFYKDKDLITSNDLKGNRSVKKGLGRGIYKDTIINKIMNADLNGACNHIKV